jgi:RHS repeat-associated protein
MLQRRVWSQLSVFLAVLMAFSCLAAAQHAPICDSGGICGTDPTDPAYGGLLASRVQKQNARGTRNPMTAFTGGPAVIRRAIGSTSYNRAIPIVSLPGRGLDLNLTLYYNSRIWTFDPGSNVISLNTDRDFPSYGFRLDFGYIEYDANNAQMIVTESDGTKHALPLTANLAGGSVYDSNDGTFMEFDTRSNILTYRNGTMVTYQPFPSQSTLFRPIQLMDTNRNFITIAYVGGTGNDQHIDTVTDTLGRVIKFNYVNNLLQSITQAVSTTTDSSGTHTWATFSWPTLAVPVTLTHNFSGVTVTGAPNSGTSINALTGCTYPNGTGYKFSYGAWGIVNRIDLLSSTGLTRSYESYNFPDTSQALNDAPRYTDLTASPDGISTSNWLYSETQSAPGQITSEKVTDQLGTVTTFALNTDGTPASVQINDSQGKFYKLTNYSWKAVGTSTMIGSVMITDNGGNFSSVSYGYDSLGNVNDLKEYDFGNQLARETVTTYMGAPYTGAPWTGGHILNLPQSIQVKDGSGTVRSRTDFAYDETTPLPLSPFPVHNDGNSTAPRGNLTSITRYPDLSDLTKKITRTFTSDAAGNLASAQLDCCNEKKFNFDPSTQYAYLSSVVRGPDTGPQFTTHLTFNVDNGLLVNNTDENGQPTSYQYDNMYRVKTVTPPLSNGQSTAQFVYYTDDSASPQTWSWSDVNGKKVVQTFDGLGHLTRGDTIDRSSGNTVSTTQFQYDAIWRRFKTSNPYAPSEPVLWNTTGYDPLNRVTSQAPPSGGGTTFNFQGNTVLITDPANKQRKNFFDGLGRLIRVDEPGWGDALSAIDSISISGSERSTIVSTRVCAQYSTSNPPRCVDWESDTSTVYDTGNVTATINGTPYTYTYGQGDDPSTVATKLAGKINSDPARLVNASPSGSTINFFAVTAGTNGNNITVSSSSVTTDGSEFGAGTTSFPAATTTATLTGGENSVAQANAVLSATRHLTTTYGYDVFDHLTSVSQGAIGPVNNGQNLPGQQRSYSYDALGRLTTSTTPESGTVTDFYTDGNGAACAGDPTLVCRVLDARGVTKNFSYEALNRLSGLTYTGDPSNTPAVNYQYDAGGQAAFANDRITKISDGANSQTFTYDNLGRITSVSNLINGTSYPVGYSYNSASQVGSVTYPTGRVVYDNYDAIGRIQTIYNGGVAQLTVNSYNGHMEPISIAYANNVQGQFSYNDHLQLSALRYFNPGAPAGTPDVLNLTYDYASASQANNNGRIQAVHYFTTPGVEDKTKSESFSYDAWNRLTQAQTLDQTAIGTWNLQWTYDRLGNRLSQGGTGNNVTIGTPSFTVDPGTNRIIGYCYDNAGNLTDEAGCPASGNPHRYSYDGANRLIAIDNNGGTSPTATYTYLGPLRIQKVTGGQTTVYIYAGAKPIAEYVNGQISKEYIYSGTRLLATVAGGVFTYHHPDHLSSRADTDPTGTVNRRFGHFPFGETWYESPGTDKWKFTSYERDSFSGETGLDYAMFRGYSPGQARFVSADLLSGDLLSPQSLNRYTYSRNDPVNWIDPLGLKASWGICLDNPEDEDATGNLCLIVEDPADGGGGGSSSGGDGGASGGGGGPGGCGGPCGDGSGGGGGGGDGKPKKDKNSARCKQLDDNYFHAKDFAHNVAFPKGFSIAFGVGEVAAVGAGCIVGAFATVEGGPLTAWAGCGLGAVAELGNPVTQLSVMMTAVGTGLYEQYNANKALDAALAQYNAECN